MSAAVRGARRANSGLRNAPGITTSVNSRSFGTMTALDDRQRTLRVACPEHRVSEIGEHVDDGGANIVVIFHHQATVSVPPVAGPALDVDFDIRRLLRPRQVEPYRRAGTRFAVDLDVTAPTA
jgi:hypothetical protein